MRTDSQLEGSDQLLASKDDEAPITVRVILGKNATNIHVVPNYRGAVRDPSIMHVSGIESQGANPDLTGHLFAKKANPSNQWFSPESGYVSTSESVDIAQRFAEQRLKGNTSGEAYIYEINPRGDAIHVQEFLQGELKAGRITRKEYFWIIGQKEISYPLKIHSQDIKGAHRVIKNEVYNGPRCLDQ